MPTEIAARYLGLQLPSPIVVGSSPLTASTEHARQLALSGAGALVLPSFFQEQIEAAGIRGGPSPRAIDQRTVDHRIALRMGCRPPNGFFSEGPDEYLRTIERVGRTVPIPVIGSLNGWSGTAWIEFASQVQAAGADAIELTLQRPLYDCDATSETIERTLVDEVRAVCQAVSIPVAVKLEPFYTNFPRIARQLTEAGAAGLVLFARDPEVDIHLDQLRVSRHWGLGHAGGIHLTLGGLMRIRSQGDPICLAANGGIASPGDVLKVLLAGADVAMVTSLIYREGCDAIRMLVDGVTNYLNLRKIASVQQLSDRRATCLEPAGGIEAGDCHASVASGDIQTSSFEDGPLFPTGDRWGHPTSPALETAKPPVG